MTNLTLQIILTLGTMLSCVTSIPAQAADYTLPLHQGNTSAVFSQGPSIPARVKISNTKVSSKIKPSELAIVPIALKKYRVENGLILSADTPLTDVRSEINLRTYDYDKLQQISPAYDINNINKLPIVGLLRYTYSGDGSQVVYRYDYESLAWHKVPSYNDVRNDQVFFSLNDERATVAVFNESNTFDGIASWYDQSRYRSFKYQGGNYTASRDYPKGTKLKVTRIKTGVSIIVTVNDYGPELQTKRLIDLDKKAFQQLASTGAGEIFVTIEKLDG